ncbi:hypothetical protein FHW04_003851 [Pantoea sp. AN62]|uniref:hypothetical protein n=1 Tax=Pantoea TaxID=53335 RepID=UPI000A23A8BA|nr:MULTISPECIES: hypothetical protein [Pantoea]MDU4747863.1 hypothetical protein [Pantoea sp.]HCR0227225.1 hypothetical protein [Enterobacter kobei]ORM51025.1 hypothetical protein HA39_22445 [Pantoea brenneri]OXM21221.1 hypothetical protein CBI35_17085 [Pantoea sp. AV62]HCR0505844.1 hypothetical protein [Enterobacter kobei]
MSLTIQKKRRRKLAQIRYLVACWKRRHLPYGGTLATCVLAGLAFAVLWREYAAHSAWAGRALVIPVFIAVAAVISRLREPLNWQDLLASKLEAYTPHDLPAYRDLQRVVKEAGFIEASMLEFWLKKETEAVFKPARRDFAFTERQPEEGISEDE